METFADVNDVKKIYRELKLDEISKVEALLPIITDSLRVEAQKVGKDLDVLALDSAYLSVLKSVTVDIVARTLMTPTEGAPMTQYAEAALGYSVSGSFLNPGGGLFIKNSELARLGFKKQRYGVIEPYGEFY